MHHNDGFEIQELDLSGGQHAKPPKHPRRNILIVTGAMLATFIGVAIATTPGTPAQDAASLPNVVSTPALTLPTGPIITKPTAPATTKAIPPKPRPTKALTVSQQNAVRSARNYLEILSFSRRGLTHQLAYDGYSAADSTFAVSYLKPDWNAQAAKSAKRYLEVMAFSHKGLLRQLEYDGFTRTQAEYGVTAAGL
jgi:hypothetical protein